jgi:hypothetical protein
MMRVVAVLPLFAAAMPENPEFTELVQQAMSGNEMPCNTKTCLKPDMKYELISKTPPGVQWMDHGGYCGSWSIQRAALARGAWISQGQVRAHTSPAGGNDEEILAGNIDEAMKNLKIKGEGWDWKNTPAPQNTNTKYFKWLKKHLTAGNQVVWFIMWNGQKYPIYNLTKPNGVYGHVEPVIGIQSNHPLDDETVYDDDVVVHYNDAGTTTFYKTFESLPGTWSGKVGDPGLCQKRADIHNQCIGPYSFGWAVLGFLDDREGLPLSLGIEPSKSEPDTRTGSSPNAITGTLLAEGLTVGTTYDIYRWDSVDEAFTYSDEHKMNTFTATSDKFVFKDPRTFSSDSATYYRCVKASSDRVVV